MTPLSAHVRACAVVVVDRRLSRDLHYIFGRYGSNTYFSLLSSIHGWRSMKFWSVHLPVVVHYSTGTTTNSASLVLKRVRIRCARICCCKVFSGRRCMSSAVLAHYSTGTTSLSMKGMQRRFCCKVFSGKLLYGPLFDGTPWILPCAKKKECSCLGSGGRRFFTVGGAPLWYSNRSPSKRTTTEAYPRILAVIILLPSRYSGLPAYQDMKIWTDYLPLL